MKLNNKEVNLYNVGSWNLDDLRAFKRILENEGNHTDYYKKTLLKLINVEIERIIKIDRITQAADAKTNEILKKTKGKIFDFTKY